MAESRFTAAMERNMRDARADLIHRDIYVALGRWRDRGWIHDWRINAGSDSSDPLAQRLNLELRLPGGRLRGYSINADEIEMAGLDALRIWLDTIERDLARHADEASRRRAVNAPPARIERPDIEAFQRIIDNAEMVQHINPDAFMREMAAIYGVAFAVDPCKEEADRKSRELFIAAAGREAFDELESGMPLPIKGSLGTDYYLFKRASYCIERPSDGARLCAVVPGVPLYDHLLGIKLMVEHDEPTFLKTANVSGARRRYLPAATGLWRSDVDDPMRW